MQNVTRSRLYWSLDTGPGSKVGAFYKRRQFEKSIESSWPVGSNREGRQRPSWDTARRAMSAPSCASRSIGACLQRPRPRASGLPWPGPHRQHRPRPSGMPRSGQREARLLSPRRPSSARGPRPSPRNTRRALPSERRWQPHVPRKRRSGDSPSPQSMGGLSLGSRSCVRKGHAQRSRSRSQGASVLL